MFRAREKIDDFVENLKKINKEKENSNYVVEAIERKKSYFDNKDFLWDTETMFRLWKKIFINLMKEDGFQSQVQTYYDLVRPEDRNQRVNRIRKHLGLYNDYHSDSNSEPILYNKVDFVCKQYENTLTNSPKSIKKELSDRRVLMDKINRIIRGRTTSNITELRKIYLRIASTLGVFFDTSKNPMNDLEITSGDVQSMKNYFYQTIEMLRHTNRSHCNNIDDVAFTDIRFITVVRRNKENLNNSYDIYNQLYDGHKDEYATEFNPEFLIKGDIVNDTKNEINYISTSYVLYNSMKEFYRLVVNDKDNIYFKKEDIVFELMKRSFDNHKIFYQLGIYNEFKKYMELVREGANNNLPYPVRDATLSEIRQLSQGSSNLEKMNNDDKKELIDKIMDYKGFNENKMNNIKRKMGI